VQKPTTPAGGSQAACLTCRGAKTINVVEHKAGEPARTVAAPCPACRGTGGRGYLTK
jgi:hypothetical protein